MEEKWKGAAEILLAALLAFFSFLLSPWLAQNFAPFGYVGVFLFSVFASATIFLPVPSWILVFSLAQSFNPLLLGISAGLGSGIGELSGYLAGRGGKYLIGGDKTAFFEEHKKWIVKAEFPTLFIVSFLPNPFFDIAGVAAGILNVPLWRFLLAVVLGKILRFTLLAYFGIQILGAFGLM
ncbi:MAG: VTT domain-containing protein [Candidatus Micrarchaeia archaeon]